MALGHFLYRTRQELLYELTEGCDCTLGVNADGHYSVQRDTNRVRLVTAGGLALRAERLVLNPYRIVAGSFGSRVFALAIT